MQHIFGRWLVFTSKSAGIFVASIRMWGAFNYHMKVDEQLSEYLAYCNGLFNLKTFQVKDKVTYANFNPGVLPPTNASLINPLRGEGIY